MIDPEKEKARRRRYYLANKERIRKYMREYYFAHKDKAREYFREYRKKRLDYRLKESERSKERYANDPEFRERIKAQSRRNYWKKKGVKDGPH